MEKAERFLPQLAANPPKLPATEIEGNPAGAKELEVDSLKTTSVNGYTTVTGTLKDGTYSDSTKIYVCVGDRWYEAYPFKENGKERFQLYLEEIPKGIEIRIAVSF
jgi:hypothetical protein